MRAPSGAQAGYRSCEVSECVRLRLSPFLAGTVNTSPRASTTARTPVGEIAAPRNMPATLRYCGRRASTSGEMLIFRSVVWPEPVFSTCSRPACSYTKSVPWPLSAFTS